MMKPLSVGEVLHGLYHIKEVVGQGGNSYVYLVEDKDIGLLLVKEYMYGLGDVVDFYELDRDLSGDVIGKTEKKFHEWQRFNKTMALKEQHQLKQLRLAGFAFYEAALQPFEEHHTYYTPILIQWGTL